VPENRNGLEGDPEMTAEMRDIVTIVIPEILIEEHKMLLIPTSMNITIEIDITQTPTIETVIETGLKIEIGNTLAAIIAWTLTRTLRPLGKEGGGQTTQIQTIETEIGTGLKIEVANTLAAIIALKETRTLRDISHGGQVDFRQRRSLMKESKKQRLMS
jgi:hypothetical protein